MRDCIKDGLNTEGNFAGRTRRVEKSRTFYSGRTILTNLPKLVKNRIVCAYAYAVGEQNAAGGRIVTAPTCGASGVLPAVML